MRARADVYLARLTPRLSRVSCLHLQMEERELDMEREIVEPRNQVRATLKRTDQRVATRSSAQPV